jgi:hypothetical protein
MSILLTLITLCTLHVPLVSLWCVCLVRSLGEVWRRGLDTVSLDCHCIIKVLKTVFLVLLMNYSGSRRNEILLKVVFYWFSPSRRFLTKSSFCHFWLFLSVFSTWCLSLVDLSVVLSSVLCMMWGRGVTLVTTLSLGIPLMPTSCGVLVLCCRGLSKSSIRVFGVLSISSFCVVVVVVSCWRRCLPNCWFLHDTMSTCCLLSTLPYHLSLMPTSRGLHLHSNHVEWTQTRVFEFGVFLTCCCATCRPIGCNRVYAYIPLCP